VQLWQSAVGEAGWLRWARQADLLYVLERDGNLDVLGASTGDPLSRLRVTQGHLTHAAWSYDRGVVLAFAHRAGAAVHFWVEP
jgi:hypothetical protein